MIHRSIVVVLTILCAGLSVWAVPLSIDHLTLAQQQREQNEMTWRMVRRTLAECDQKYAPDTPDEDLPPGMRLLRQSARQDVARLEQQYPQFRGKKLD
jgi:hypothetical protein